MGQGVITGLVQEPVCEATGDGGSQLPLFVGIDGGWRDLRCKS